jgi:uncharacterized protein
MAAPVLALQFEESDVACDCCTRATCLRYTGVIYGDAPDTHSVCPWCIADGTVAQAWKASFNTVDPRSPCDPDAKTEAECRTPGFPTWQDLWIPVCCGMPTEFLGDAGWDELSEAWAGAVSSLLTDCCPGENESERSEFLRSLRAGGNPGAYVFRCLSCAALVGRWDCL